MERRFFVRPQHVDFPNTADGKQQNELTITLLARAIVAGSDVAISTLAHKRAQSVDAEL